jgi:hypothetical protein
VYSLVNLAKAMDGIVFHSNLCCRRSQHKSATEHSGFRLDITYSIGIDQRLGVFKVRIWPDFVTRSRERQLGIREDELRVEQAKRDSSITPDQRGAWNDGLLKAMVDNPAYRLKYTKESRFAEQAELLRFMEDNKGRRNEPQD